MQSTSTDDFIGANSSKAGSRKSHSKGSPVDVSPDSKCPICLDRFENISHLDRCLHRFCFKCIKEWAKNKAECPLCKQPFNSIFHSVRAEDDFKEYFLRPTLNGSFASPDGQRFRYRTTMTRDNQLPTRTLRSSAHRTFSPPDNGVLFERYTNRPSHERGSNIQQMMRRLASRRQASAEGRTMRQIQEQELINFRRALYRSGIRVRNIQDGGRYRDISAEFFRRNPACLHRLIPWLKRELTVIFGTHGSLVNIVQHIIMSNVTRYDMESQAFLEDLQPFLLHRTEHFLHEFINFARCPYNIDAYDQHANYDCPASSFEGSESESSVITISPDEIIREPDVPSSSVDVGEAPWDDETPGPSYSTVEQATSNVLTTVESSDEEPSSSRLDSTKLDNDTTDDIQSRTVPSDDCMIVGYVKPLAERTPELVELSSDSEYSLCEVKIEQTKKPPEKPFSLFGSSESHRSSSSSSHSSYKPSHKAKNRPKTSSEKSDSKKKKEIKSAIVSSRRLLDSKKDGKHSYNQSTSRLRERSLSSDCYSRSSRNKASESHKKLHSKSKHKAKTREKLHKSWRERRRSHSKDRSLSWRSRTVSLSSESSRERNRSSSRNRRRGRGRSRSRDCDNTENYRSTYHWEYTYYSRNRDREEFQKSYKKHSNGKGHCSRFSASPDYHLQTFSHKKESRKQRESTNKRHHHSRSRSNSQATTVGSQQTQSDKPSGKRKYKTRHLEPTNKNKSSEKDGTNAKEDHAQVGSRDSETNFTDKSSNEPKLKWRKKARSPSVEIVYEGTCTQDGKHHKKKKKKHKKKRRRDQSSPVVIRIDSDSDTAVRLDVPCSDHANAPPNESKTALFSDVPTSSAPVNTADENCVEAVSPYSKACNLPSVNEYLESATDIIDSLYFGESLDGQAFLPSPSPPKTPSFLEETAVTDLSTCNFALDRETSTPPVTAASQENLAGKSPEIIEQAVCEHLQSMPSTALHPMVSEEDPAEDSQDMFAETVGECLEDVIEPISPNVL